MTGQINLQQLLQVTLTSCSTTSRLCSVMCHVPLVCIACLCICMSLTGTFVPPGAAQNSVQLNISANSGRTTADGTDKKLSSKKSKKPKSVKGIYPHSHSAHYSHGLRHWYVPRGMVLRNLTGHGLLNCTGHTYSCCSSVKKSPCFVVQCPF